jgi:hypothetical protein
MSSFRPLSLLLLLLAVLGLAPAAASAQDLSASAVNVEVTASGDAVEAKFNVAVANRSAAAAANVWVVFEDGLELQVGDVAAEGTASSALVTRTFAEVLTANHPVKVTLKYSVDGASVEQVTMLIVRVK